MSFELRILPLVFSTFLFAGCGGGGGGGSASSTPSTPTSSNSCSTAGQLGFVRNHIDHDYLFYRDVPATNPATYNGTPDDFFYDLTTRALPAKDRFSFVITAAEAQAIFQDGASVGVGIDTRRDSLGRLRIALVQTGSPAALAGLRRGDRITSINDSVVGSTMSDAQILALYYANTGENVKINYQRLPGTTDQTVTLTANNFTSNPVPVSTTLSSNGRKIGYIAFHEHTEPSEPKLADAFRQLALDGAQDLVLDLRYNGGGYITIAAQVAYMIAGNQTKIPGMPGFTKIFDLLAFNDKRSAENLALGFYDSIIFNSARQNELLSTLSLNRVYVLTSDATCSASEAIINGLRGIDVSVITIGKTTCGKPYGMIQTNNCSNSYFALAFQGFNAKNFGAYTSGFAPNCTVSDDLDHNWGDPAEGMLAAALTHINTGNCPAPVSTAIASTRSASLLSVQDHVKRTGWGTSLLKH